MFSVAKLFSLSACFMAATAVVVENEARQNNLPAPFGGTHSGDGTFFEPGVGACGINNGPSDLIVAISTQLFDTFPGHTANPNNNPVCKRTITATFNGKSVTAHVRDRCVGCGEFDLDFSPGAFKHLASESVGRIHGVKWRFN